MWNPTMPTKIPYLEVAWSRSKCYMKKLGMTQNIMHFLYKLPKSHIQSIFDRWSITEMGEKNVASSSFHEGNTNNLCKDPPPNDLQKFTSNEQKALLSCLNTECEIFNQRKQEEHFHI